MTATVYPNGYGKRERPPECSPLPLVIECPCCQGRQEHGYGHGMDADALTCSTCNGYGYLTITTSKPGPRKPAEATKCAAKYQTESVVVANS